MTLLRFCTEILNSTNLINFFGWVGLFDAKILLLLLRNNELTLSKLIKLISYWEIDRVSLKLWGHISYDESLLGTTLIEINYMLKKLTNAKIQKRTVSYDIAVTTA